MKGAFDTRLVTGQAIEFGLEIVVVEQVEISGGAGAKLSFHATDASKVPGGRYQVVEECLLDCALGSDVGLVIGKQSAKFFAIFRADN